MSYSDYFRELGITQYFGNEEENIYDDIFSLKKYKNKTQTTLFIYSNDTIKYYKIHSGKKYVLFNKLTNLDQNEINIIKKSQGVFCISKEIKDCLENYSIKSELIIINFNQKQNLIIDIDKSDFYSYLNNETIAIVGPSPTANKNQGKYIDLYNIVVRLNKCWNIFENDDYGYKIDILVNCMNESEECGGIIPDSIIKKIKYLVCAYPIISKNDDSLFKKGNKFNIERLEYFYSLNPDLKIISMSKEEYLDLENRLKCIPNTGLIAKYIISKSNYKKLFITGFSFFQKGYNLDYRKSINGNLCTNEIESEKAVLEFMSKSGNHKQEPQIELCRDLFLNKENILMDQYYKNILRYGVGEDIKNNLNKKTLFVVTFDENIDENNELTKNIKDNNFDYVVIKNDSVKILLEGITNIQNYEHIVKIDSGYDIDINKLMNQTYFGSYDFYGMQKNEDYNMYPLYSDKFFILSKKCVDLILNSGEENIYKIMFNNHIVPKYENFIKKIKIKDTNKDKINIENGIKHNEYNFNFIFDSLCDYKLFYKLVKFNDVDLIDDKKEIYSFSLRDGKIYLNDKYTKDYGNGKLYILLKDDKYNIFIDNEIVLILDDIVDIKLNFNHKYDCSINIPISCKNASIETIINFDYILNLYLKYGYQINICHTDDDYNLLDYLCMNLDVNYIYVKNPFKFNLGYTRNMHIFLNLSNNIMFVDVDIPLEKEMINNMIDKIGKENYDIVKPYDKNLFHTTFEEKYKYMKNNFFDFTKKIPKCLFTITGGITIFKKEIFDEIGGYEEINGYGMEDRCMDVQILYRNKKYYKFEFNLVHLYHPNSVKDDDLHLRVNESFKLYGCKYDKTAKDFLHENCKHETKYLDDLLIFNKNNNFNLKLFENNHNCTLNLKSLIFDNDVVLLNDKSFGTVNFKTIVDNKDKLYVIKPEDNSNIIQNNHKIILQHLMTNKFLNSNNKKSNNKEYFFMDNNTIKILNGDIIKIYKLCDQSELELLLNNKYNDQNTNKFKEYLKNKKVILVGPADHVNDGKFIDSYDVVVRMNKGIDMIQYHDRYGSRTDILYHVVNQHIENGGILENNKIKNSKFIRLSYPIFKLTDETSFKNIGTLRDYLNLDGIELNNLSIIDKNEYINFENQILTRPNCGTVAIKDLLDSELKELYITGFTLFKTNYADVYRNLVDGKTDTGNQAQLRMKTAGNHDQNKILNYYKKKLLNNNRVKMDDKLYNILI